MSKVQSAPRRGRRFVAAAVALGLVGASAALVQRAGAEENAADTVEAADPVKAVDDAGDKGPRLVKPFSQMTTLDGEQRRTIARIHKDALKKIRDVREQEETDILAVLNDDQKAEYERLLEQDKMKRSKKADDAEAGQ